MPDMWMVRAGENAYLIDAFKDLNDIQLVNTISKEIIDKALDIQELIHETNALQMRWEFDDF